jgi:hypothetical protein
MKKAAIVFLLFSFTSCSFLNTITKHCKTETSTTPNGNSIFCAMCDSTAGKEILKSIKPKK